MWCKLFEVDLIKANFAEGFYEKLKETEDSDVEEQINSEQVACRSDLTQNRRKTCFKPC